jgi:hypothetical protein
VPKPVRDREGFLETPAGTERDDQGRQGQRKRHKQLYNQPNHCGEWPGWVGNLVGVISPERINEMEKYSWNFNKDAEFWNNDSHDTIEDCISAAKEAAKDEYLADDSPTIVHIGENVPFVPWIDPSILLDSLEEQASDFNELGGDWLAYNPKNKDELKELEESLTAVMMAWLKKYGYEPSFFNVENVSSYPLT